MFDSLQFDFQDWLRKNDVIVSFQRGSYRLEVELEFEPETFSPLFPSTYSLYSWWVENKDRVESGIKEYREKKHDFDFAKYRTWLAHEEMACNSGVSASKYLESSSVVISMHLYVEETAYTKTIKIMRQDRSGGGCYAWWEKVFYIQQEDAEHTHSHTRSLGSKAHQELFESLKTVFEVDTFLQERGYNLQRETTTPLE